MDSEALDVRRAIFNRFGPIYVYRGIAGNRLVVGIPPDLGPTWESVLDSLDFHRVPSDNGDLLIYWVVRTHPPFSELGDAHTDALVDAIRSTVSSGVELTADSKGVPYFRREGEATESV